jgi:hypothetical protein
MLLQARWRRDQSRLRKRSYTGSQTIADVAAEIICISFSHYVYALQPTNNAAIFYSIAAMIIALNQFPLAQYVGRLTEISLRFYSMLFSAICTKCSHTKELRGCGHQLNSLWKP